MSDPAIIAWLRAQQPTLDQALADHLRRTFRAHPEWSDFELAQTLEDTWRLSRGEDCFYDRPSIGPIYASWYHARRMQDVLLAMLPWLDEEDIDVWSILDLGCGTGATLWAAALLALAVREAKGRSLTIEYVGIDASLFMLEEAKALWSASMIDAYPEALTLIAPRFGNGTWPRIGASLANRPRVIGAFFLDRSDVRRTAEIVASLGALVKRHEAGRLLLLSSRSKEGLVRQAAAHFPSNEWLITQPTEPPLPLWSGGLSEVSRARHECFADRRDVPVHLWSRTPPWSSAQSECTSVQLTARSSIAWSLFAGRGLPKVILDEAQKHAAQPDSRSTIVTGAAGSGKSLVLAQRLAASVRGGTQRVFVTAFNKAVIDQLAHWTYELLRGEGWTLRSQLPSAGEHVGHWVLSNAEGTRSILLINWDRAMTRIFGVRPFTILKGRELDEELQRTADVVAKDHKLPAEQIKSITAPGFLLAERHRVMFGLRALTEEEFMRVERTGRGRSIGPRQRKAILDIFNQLERRMLIDRRIEALRRVDSGAFRSEPFDLVVVDEVQDFTPADFDLLHALTNSNGTLVVAGDLTQSMQIGRSHRIPALPSKARWKRHYLPGSYRIPLRICECLRPLAEQVAALHEAKLGEDAVLPESRKAAVLGIRPILVHAPTISAQAEQIRMIWSHYGRLQRNQQIQRLDRMTITERDDALGDAVRVQSGYRLTVEVETMRRIKGLERPFIVWSTRSPLENADECEEEWVYTILSRTTRILVIVTGPQTSDVAERIMRTGLRHDRIMPWTKEAQHYLERLRGSG